MKPWSTVLPALVLAASAAAVLAEEPFVCNVGALTPGQRERHQKLGKMLRAAAMDRQELENGFVFSLDLSRLPKDAAAATPSASSRSPSGWIWSRVAAPFSLSVSRSRRRARPFDCV